MDVPGYAKPDKLMNVPIGFGNYLQDRCVILQQPAKVGFTQASQPHFGPSLCEDALQYVLAPHIAAA